LITGSSLDRAPSNLLVDTKGRVAAKLRISLTDRCNFACLFCMPDKSDVHWLPSTHLLSFDEIERLTRVFVSMGIGRVRITGGEPLLRNGVEDLVRRLTGIDGLESVDMTTNGYFLGSKAQVLKDAGLRGVTVSLHSLREDRFARISGMNALPRVLESISEAVRVGLHPMKINSVAIRGYNDDEILDMVDFARKLNVGLRFIEFMPLDGLGIWNQEKIVTGQEIVDIVRSKFTLVAKGRGRAETASVWEFSDGRGELGVITSMSEPFCDDCDRLRLTADGKLLSCLFDTEYYDLKPILRNSGEDEKLRSFIRESVWKKPEGVGYMPWIKQEWKNPRNMNAIGG
jgi:cyclic pyranopterin phosphate synthase